MGLALGYNVPIMTPVCHRILAGITGRAAAEQCPVQKAVPLPIHIQTGVDQNDNTVSQFLAHPSIYISWHCRHDITVLYIL